MFGEIETFIDGHSDCCNQQDAMHIIGYKTGEVNVRENHQHLRNQYSSDIEQLIDPKNILGTLWAIELNRLQAEDVGPNTFLLHRVQTVNYGTETARYPGSVYGTLSHRK